MALQKMVRLHDREFKVLVPYNELEESINIVANRINNDYKDKECPLFVGVLNGAFMFMSELVKRVDFLCEISFIKIASYSGTASSGSVSELIGLADNIKGRHIIIVEDIVDTGNSIEYLLRSLKGHEPASVAVATLLFKREAYTKEYKIDYFAKEVPNRFIIGFGLDYNHLGRNLKDIYEVVNE